eukprot:490139-Hanusia_phi.AAC.1
MSEGRGNWKAHAMALGRKRLLGHEDAQRLHKSAYFSGDREVGTWSHEDIRFSLKEIRGIDEAGKNSPLSERGLAKAVVIT